MVGIRDREGTDHSDVGENLAGDDSVLRHWVLKATVVHSSTFLSKLEIYH